jgi:hypothetical protein
MAARRAAEAGPSRVKSSPAHARRSSSPLSWIPHFTARRRRRCHAHAAVHAIAAQCASVATTALSAMNLYAALRAHFPALDEIAIETADAPGGADGPEGVAGLRYRWSDLERGSARMAALFADLALPPGRACSCTPASPSRP